MSTRPDIFPEDPSSAVQGWDAAIRDALAGMVRAPFPPKEYADVPSLPDPTLYRGCFAATLSPPDIWLSNGVAWVSASGALPVTMMKWAGEFLSGTEYSAYDVTRDGSYLAIANKTTYDSPAPQFIDVPKWGWDDEAPGFSLQSSGAQPQWVTVQRYAAGGRTGMIRALRIWCEPGLEGLYRYTVTLILNPQTSAQTIQLGVFTPITPGWNVVWAGEILIAPDEEIDLVTRLDDANPGAPTVEAFDWNYSRSNGDPGSGQAMHSSNSTNLRIGNEDDGGTNRRANLLALRAGDTIAAGGITWTLEADADGTDSGFVAFVVTPATRASNGLYTFTLSKYGDISFSYAREDNTFTGDPDASGFEGTTYADAIGAGANNHGYGIDLLFDAAIVSEDWDYLAISSTSGGGGSSSDIHHGNTPPTNTSQLWSWTDGPLGGPMLMQYDETRSKWLSTTSEPLPAGRGGGLTPGAEAGLIGFGSVDYRWAPHNKTHADICIVAIDGQTRIDTMSTDFKLHWNDGSTPYLTWDLSNLPAATYYNIDNTINASVAKSATLRCVAQDAGGGGQVSNTAFHIIFRYEYVP